MGLAERIGLRPMTDDDFALVNTWRGDPRLAAFAGETDRGGEIVEIDGEPVGWIDPHAAYAPAWNELLGPSVGDRPWTLDLFVLPDRWNQGVGRSAIRAVSQRCLSGDATSMVVDIERSNVASKRAFQGAGWVVVPTDEDAVILRYPPTQR